VAAVDRDVGELQADEAVVRLQDDQFEFLEDAEAYPLVAACADGGRRAHGVGNPAVARPEDQHLDDLVEDETVLDPRAVTAERMTRINRSTPW
jgi:hypothetical protein